MDTSSPLTRTNLNRYLAERGHKGGSTLIRALGKTRQRYAITDTPSIRAGLAKDMAAVFDGRPSLFFFEDWGVWPNSRVPGLVERIRTTAGITQPIIKVPGEIVPATANSYLMHLIAATLYSYDGFVLMDVQAEFGWLVSHDEWAIPIFSTAIQEKVVRAVLTGTGCVEYHLES